MRDWVLLRPGWRDDLALTMRALAMRWRTIHLVHEDRCPRTWACVSVNRLAEVVDGCVCGTLRFRPLPF